MDTKKNVLTRHLNLSDDNPYSEFLLTVMADVNQLERDLIRMRQKVGIAKKKHG